MDAIVFIPGILGSRLALNGEEVWPPTPVEAWSGYHRIPQLMDPGVIATGIIDNVLCFQFYRPIDDDLSAIAASTGGVKIDFFYDWRKDIKLSTAPRLAEQLEETVANGAQSVTLVAHSMGGLIARLLLESGDWAQKPWFGKITRFVGICDPHHGAPQALAEALGLAGTSGISPDDMPTLTSDPRYPAAYQNLPAPNYNRLRKQPGNIALNIYKSSVAKVFSLSLSNLAAAKNSFAALDLSKRPATVEYALIAGSQQSTLEQINVVGSTLSFVKDTAGDGTVPLWSAAPGAMGAFVTPGDHVGILKTGPFRTHLFEILTGNKVMAQRFDVRPVVTISMDKVVYAPGEPMSVLIVPDSPSHEIKGTLQFAKATDAAGRLFAQHGAEHPVQYLGAPVQNLPPMQIQAPTEPGAYRLSFEGNHTSTEVTSAVFVVSQAGGVQTRQRGK